jgi:hypothetical protein
MAQTRASAILGAPRLYLGDEESQAFAFSGIRPRCFVGESMLEADEFNRLLSMTSGRRLAMSGRVDTDVTQC